MTCLLASRIGGFREFPAGLLVLRQSPGATLGDDLIDIAARTARHDRITLHLPEGWHREQEWIHLFEAATGPPAQWA